MGFENEDKELFVKALLSWNRMHNKRKMPWKGLKDPYKIWLSEIILQQTRVDQGLKYYQNFTSNFPSIRELALAPDEKIYKLWEGLGYYTRCKNLIITARFIYNELHGKFPDTYEDILKLNGIGTYTAAAISSFAFNLPYAVLDGNVFRILSRIYDIHIPVDSTEGKNLFKKTAQELLPVKKSAEYNQAIMDFGAIICSPLPKCTICFCNKFCISYKNGEQNNLPVKLKKIKIRERWLTYFLIVCDNEILIHKRIHKDIWHQLFEFLLIETDHKPSHQLLSDILNDQYNLPNTIFSDIEDINQKLSHQLIHFSFKMIHATTKISIIDYIWISKNELIEYPFPKTLLQVVLKHFK